MSIVVKNEDTELLRFEPVELIRNFDIDFEDLPNVKYNNTDTMVVVDGHQILIEAVSLLIPHHLQWCTAHVHGFKVRFETKDVNFLKKICWVFFPLLKTTNRYLNHEFQIDSNMKLYIVPEDTSAA